MYNLELLARLTDLTKRTIRYYIQIGLLEPPNGTCRGSYYTEEHLSRLEQIRKWAQQGIPLSQIKEIVSSNCPVVKADVENCVYTSKWERFEVMEGVELHFRSDYIKPENLKQIEKFIKNILDCDNDNLGY